MRDSTSPYAPPSESENADARIERTSDERQFRPFLLATGLVASVMLAQFCALDFFVVRIRPYPDEVHDYDALLLLFPLLPIALLLRIARTRLQSMHGGVLIASIFAGFFFSSPLIATAGVWFHFVIGGTL